ncbi:MAG: hypothetical protein J7556_09455 [Acidovorax sp.]|nr:hypothetical protein [Acidovorax sp.]
MNGESAGIPVCVPILTVADEALFAAVGSNWSEWLTLAEWVTVAGDPAFTVSASVALDPLAMVPSVQVPVPLL